MSDKHLNFRRKLQSGDRMMRNTPSRSMLHQVAVVLGYVAVYTLIRPISDAHWQLTAGLRLALLLLVPYRYLTALAIGDTISCAYQSSLYAAQFGLSWAIADSLPMIAFAMPVVWFCREKLTLF